MGILERTRNAWNIFLNKETLTKQLSDAEEIGYSVVPYRAMGYAQRYSKKTIIDPIITRIAIDVAELSFKHIKLDKNTSTEEEQQSGLNRCLTLEANLDQTCKDFIQDIVTSMFDEGVVAVVPVDTDDDPMLSASYGIETMRTGKIVGWHPKSVDVSLYNDRTGQQEQVKVSKAKCAIIPNPLYDIVNAENSSFKRLERKLQLLDTHDEKNASNKLDMIIQTPYAIKSDTRKAMAKERVEDIEKQLTENKYGIAYIGADEKVTQLGRSLENNLLQEITALKDEVYNQLGMTKAVFDGTASESEITNYLTRSIRVIGNRIRLEFHRKFLTDTARTQGHAIICTSDPFYLIPPTQVGGLADSLRRNEIASTNEIRNGIHLPRSDDPKADLLFNPNMPTDQDTGMQGTTDKIQAESDEEAAKIFEELPDQQFQELVAFAQGLVGENVPLEQISESLNDEQFKMVVDKAKELMNGTKNEETG